MDLGSGDLVSAKTSAQGITDEPQTSAAPSATRSFKFKGQRYRNLVTFGAAGLIFTVCLSCFGLSQQSSKRARPNIKTNNKLVIQVTASRSLIKLPPRSADLSSLTCELTESEVKLYANATSPHKAEINFTWQVPVGRLIRKGREVVWDLSGVQEGTYTATVEASDRHKNTGKGSIAVTVVICPGWRPDPPPCPSIEEKLAQIEDEFRRSAEYVLKKNADLYRRLS